MTGSHTIKLCVFALIVAFLGYYIQPYILASSPTPSLFATGLLVGALLGGFFTQCNARCCTKGTSNIALEDQLHGQHVLYVGNMPFNAQEDEIRRLFEAYGEVKAIRIVTGGPNKRPKGYCFVEMDKSGAEAALVLNGKEFAGRKLRINQARQKKS